MFKGVIFYDGPAFRSFYTTFVGILLISFQLFSITGPLLNRNGPLLLKQPEILKKILTDNEQYGTM